MNILLISDVYFPRVNGVSTSIKTFSDQMRAFGHQVHLIAPAYGAHENNHIDEAWVSRVSANSIFFDPEDRLMKMRAVMRLVPQLKAMQFDVLHIHTPFIAHYAGLKLAKALNIPKVETYHTFFEDYLHHYLPWIPKVLARSIARNVSKRQCNQVDGVVSPSQPMLDVLRTYEVTAHAEVIPTGLQDASFELADGAAFRKKYDIPADRPMLLYVGRVAHEKNICFLLEVMRLLVEEVPDVLLLITGEGPAEKTLQHKSHHFGLDKNVRFLGYLDRHLELNACYQSADIFVFASKSETQGLVLLETMAQATPVVAIAELGTASILVEGKGARIAEEDEADFVDKIHALLINKAERKTLGEQGRSYALAQWSSQRQAERMLAFYQQVIAKQILNKKVLSLST